MALLTVPIHLQDRFDLCGPACAQMVIRSLGGALAPQDFSKILKDDDDWFTTPTRLETLINSLRPNGVPPYIVSTGNTFTKAMGRVTASLNKGFPVVVLASGGEHWVVVRGVTGGGASRFVHTRDPFPDRTLVPGMPKPLPPHADSDSCDEGDQLGGAAANVHGESDEVVRWNQWKTHYFTPCALGNAPWLGERVVIAADLTELPEPEAISQPIVRSSQPISETAAIELARKALAESELSTEAGWADAIHGPVISGEPYAVKVERLDGGPSYFLVVLTDREGRGVVAQLDDESGELIGARLMSRRLARSLLAPPPDGHRRFVWQSSANSFYSPYFPFSEVRQLSGPPLYRRILDGRTFRDLTRPAEPLY